MEKIPVTKLPSTEQDDKASLSRLFLTDALEILLLGSIWVFVLLWMPFFQDMSGGSLGDAILAQAMDMQLSVVALLSLVLLVLGWRFGGYSLKQKLLLLVVLLVSLVPWLGRLLAYWDLQPLLVPILVLQAILGLGFFLSRRS